MNTNHERDFFTIIFVNDLWYQIKKLIYPGKLTTNFFEFTAGNIATGYGYLGLMKNNPYLIYTSDAMNYAAQNGHFDVIVWLHQNKPNGCSPDAMNHAAYGGHFEIVKSLHEKKISSYGRDILAYALESGHTEMVKWIYENTINNFSYNDYVLEQIIPSGNVNLLDFMIKKFPQLNFRYAIDISAKYGHLEIIKWLYQNQDIVKKRIIERLVFMKPIIDSVAKNGHLDVIKWLHHNHIEACGCTTDAMDNAAINGHLDIVKWLHYNRTEGCSSKAMIGAIKAGHLEIVKWLHYNKPETIVNIDTELVISSTVDYQHHLNIIEWFYQMGYQIDVKYMINVALDHDNLELIKWFHAHGHECLIFEIIDSRLTNTKKNLKIYAWISEIRKNNLLKLYFGSK